MLINKSTTNKHNIVSNFSDFSRQIRRPPTPQLKVVTASSVEASYSVDGATSGNSHHFRHAERHHDFQMQRLWRHCDRLDAQRTCAFRGSSWWYFSSVVVILGVIVLPLAPHCEAAGYSYTRFIGPVSGPEHRIYVRDRDTHKGGDDGKRGGYDPAAHLDYVAKPEYEFAYGVEDAQAHVLHNRNEMRDGDAVKGVYSVVDPDGTLRVVKYTADDIYGFQAEVILNGISTIHGQLQPDTPTTISNLHKSNPTSNDVPYPIYTYPLHSDNDNNYHYDSYQFSTHPAAASPPIISISENNDESDYADGHQSHNNKDEYQPQYEVHEQLSDEDDGEDSEHDHKAANENDQYKEEKEGYDDTKKDYEDNDQEEDEYDDSDELEDYDDEVKINDNKADKESDDYY